MARRKVAPASESTDLTWTLPDVEQPGPAQWDEPKAEEVEGYEPTPDEVDNA